MGEGRGGSRGVGKKGMTGEEREGKGAPSSDPLPLPMPPLFSERELKFMFAICRRPSVCLSSVVCL